MKYRLERYVLDREGGMLTRDGQQIDITWRALVCVASLVEERHRVVGYDELIRRIWGHRDATNHQLSQVVLAARRALGDDGQAQRLIRTIPGLGYRWVGAAVEVAEDNGEPILPLSHALDPVVGPDTGDQDIVLSAPDEPQAVPADRIEDATTQSPLPPEQHPVDISGVDTLSGPPMRGEEAAAHAPEAREPMALPCEAPPLGAVIDASREVPTDTTRPGIPSGGDAWSGRIRRGIGVWPVALLGFGLVSWLALQAHRDDKIDKVASDKPNAETTARDPLAYIEHRLWSADIEDARRALSRLPPSLAESNEARLLAIRMEIEQGRYDRAEQRFEIELADPRAVVDPVWRARLLSWQSYLRSRTAQEGERVLRPAREAVALIESAGRGVPSRVIGEAMSARGTAYIYVGDFEAAVKDLVVARDILLKETDKRVATTTRHMLAYSWLRMGRLAEARDEFLELSQLSRRMDDPFAESQARNSATRIQIELLQWDAAIVNSRLGIEAAEQVPNPSQIDAALRAHALVLANTGRLRDAQALLDRVDEGDAVRRTSVASTMLRLAKGESQEALIDAAVLFAGFEQSDNPNLILQSREGAMLLWTMAAYDLRQAGKTVPTPSTAQMQILERPETIPGRIAKGWWLYTTGSPRQAEDVLREAIALSREEGRLFYMTLAIEPLAGLLLDRNDVAAADAILAMVRGQNPERMDRDYRVARLLLRSALAKKDRKQIEEAYAVVKYVAGERNPSVVVRQGGSTVPGRSSGRTKGFD